nr:phage portal protein [Phycocomes zhengii]
MTLRQRIGAFIGGFDAGQHHRRLRGFRATRAHVNALIAASGPDITARARWLVRNNGYAVNAVESWAANTVGDGIKPISKIGDAARKEALQRLWLDWTDAADAEGLTDFYGLQRRAAREVFIAGEVFVRIRPRRAEDGLPVPLQLQLLPSEMLPLEQSDTAANGNAIRQGIEFDRIGRRVAYHLLRRHPGDSTDPGLAGETVRVPASEIIHVIDPVEGGQLRGVSKLAPAIVKLFLLDQYDDAELDRKKVAAMYAMFVTSPAPENPLAPPEDEDGMGGLEISPGQVVRLDPGEDVTVGQPADSGATYEPFQYRTLLQISAALGIPYPYLANDMVKGNFSNSRLALIEFRRRVSAWQHAVMVYQLCRPVWVRWIDAAVLSGALSLPGYETDRARLQAADWLPTKWDWVDPLKDANAEIAQIEAGLKSRTQAIAERGYDAEQVDREIAAEHARERALGLDFRCPGSPAQGVQAGADGDGTRRTGTPDDDPDDSDTTDAADDRPRNDEDRP